MRIKYSLENTQEKQLLSKLGYTIEESIGYLDFSGYIEKVKLSNEFSEAFCRSLFNYGDNALFNKDSFSLLRIHRLNSGRKYTLCNLLSSTIRIYSIDPGLFNAFLYNEGGQEKPNFSVYSGVLSYISLFDSMDRDWDNIYILCDLSKPGICSVLSAPFYWESKSSKNYGFVIGGEIGE